MSNQEHLDAGHICVAHMGNEVGYKYTFNHLPYEIVERLDDTYCWISPMFNSLATPRGDYVS